MNGSMDRWINGSMGRWIDGSMDGTVAGLRAAHLDQKAIDKEKQGFRVGGPNF